MIWALLAASEAITASEVKYDLRFEIRDPNYRLFYEHIVDMVWFLLAASKQPLRSKLSLLVKLVIPIYYMTKFHHIFISEKMTLW